MFNYTYVLTFLDVNMEEFTGKMKKQTINIVEYPIRFGRNMEFDMSWPIVSLIL